MLESKCLPFTYDTVHLMSEPDFCNMNTTTTTTTTNNNKTSIYIALVSNSLLISAVHMVKMYYI